MNKNQIAPDNNKLALDRTVLANDRTYQAWIRTGLALFASGLGAAKFLKEEMSSWIMDIIRYCFTTLTFKCAVIFAGWLAL